MRKRPSLSSAVRVYTPEDLCAVLQIGERKCYDLLRSRQIPAIKVGATWRIAEPALLAYLQGQSAAAAVRPLAQPKTRKTSGSQRQGKPGKG
jgi:excisionase family DNA binding protein